MIDTNILKTTPWDDLFAPKEMSDIVIPSRIESILSAGIQRDYLFYGTSGIGKSTIAKVLTSKMNCLYVNASVNGKIDSLRELIKDFAMGASIDFAGDGISDKKVVYLDEIDGASKQFYDGLRGFMDEYDTVTYVATCNHINKLTDAMVSRFTPINFNFENDAEKKELRGKYAKRVIHIIKETGIKFNKDTFKPTLGWLITRDFPDFRNIIQSLQTIHLAELPFEIASFQKSATGVIKVLDTIFAEETTPELIHQLVMANYQNDPGGVLGALGTSVYDYISKSHPFKMSLLPQFIITIADSQASLPMVIDPIIALKACIFKLNNLAKSQK